MAVAVPPKVLVQGDNEAQAVSMSGRVVLNCPVVAGDPPPQITWLKNDSHVLLNERVYQLSNGSLVIYDVTVRTTTVTAVTVNSCPKFCNNC